MTVYDLGDPAALSVSIRDTAGTLADATTVVCTITLPDATTTTPSVTHSSTGVYSVSYTPTLAGRYKIRWVATGTNTSAYSDIFDVFASDPRFLISLADAREVLNLTSSNTTHDEELRLYLAAATVVIDAIDRPYLLETRTHTFHGGSRTLVLPETQIGSVTSITANGSTLPASSYRVDEFSGVIHAYYSWFPAGIRNIVVTYTTGDDEIPANVILAARELVRHWWQRSQQTPRPQFQGGVADGDMTYVANYAIPNFVVGILSPRYGVN